MPGLIEHREHDPTDVSGVVRQELARFRAEVRIAQERQDARVIGDRETIEDGALVGCRIRGSGMGSPYR